MSEPTLEERHQREAKDQRENPRVRISGWHCPCGVENLWSERANIWMLIHDQMTVTCMGCQRVSLIRFMPETVGHVERRT